MLSDDQGITIDQGTIQPILTNGESLPEKPRITIWHWIGYYLYNLARKPKVWMKQRELKEISDTIQKGLRETMYPRMTAKPCKECREAFIALRPQIFLSQIELILKRKCSSHSKLYEDFLFIYHNEFRRSEEISRWINGFGK